MLIQKSADFSIQMDTGIAFADITPTISRLVSESNVMNGIVHLVAIGSTASLTSIEYEPGALEDLKSAIDSMAPAEKQYAHELTWHDGNGHSHVQAAIMGPSLSLPIRSGELSLGTWQQVTLINHDNRPRNRKVALSIIGQCA
mgnify:CR=1 FL=1